MADVTKDTRILTDAEFDDLLSRADAAIAEIDRATAKGGAYADALAGKEISEGRAQSAEFNRGVETETAKSAGRAASATRGFEAKQSADRAKRSMDVSAKSSKASVALTKANVKKNRAQTAADLAQTDYSNAEHDAYNKVTDDLRERKFALTKRKAAASKSGSGGGGTATDGVTPERGSYNNNRGQITPPKSLADRDPLGLREQNGQFVTDKNGNKTWKQDETGLKHTANTKTSVSRIDDFADTVFRNMAHTVDANGNYVYDLDYINENVKGSSIQRKCMNAYMTVQNTYTDILENGLSAAKRKDYIEAMKNVGVNEAYATGLVDDLGKYYAATLKKNMTAQAQLAKALGLEQSLDVRGYIATALDVGAYDTDFALGLIGQNDGDHIVSVSLSGMQKIGKGLPSDLAVQKQNAGNGDYIEVEKKNINIDTATSDEIYSAAQRSVNDAEKAFLLGVLADRVINKGESDRHGILQEHAAALRENEEKKERAKNAKESREELEAYAKETYGEYAEQYIKFVENPQEAEAYIENFCSGDVGTFTGRESKVGKFILDGISDNTGSFFHDFAGFDGRVTGDFIEDGKHSSTHKGNKNIEIALEAIRFVDPEKGFELYNKIASAAKQAYDIYEYAAKRYREEYARTDHFDNTYYFANDLAVHYRELYNICVNRKEQAWVSWKLSLLGNDGELAQGLVDIYTDGISYWDTGEMTAAEAEKFDVEVLKDVLTRVYDKQGNDISRDTLVSVTQTEDGKPLSKLEQVKALLDFAMDKAAVYDESFAQKYAEAYIKRYLPGLPEETGGDVAYAIELLGDQIKAQKMQEAIREGMNTDNGFVNALLDLGGLVLSVGTFFASAPAFLEATFSGGGDRPKNYYGTFGRVSLAGQQMRQEAIGDFSRHVSGNIGAALFGEDARATTEEWSNAILSGAMSVLDSYVSGKIFGGLAKIASANFGVSATVAMNFAKKMTLFTMSSGAGYSTMVQMHEKGYSDREAVAYGWVSAFAEYISETINIDTVVSPEKLKGAKAHLWNMFEEGTEEVISNIVNDVYDLAIMQDSGEIAKEIEEYVSAGEDRGSAVRKVIGDHLYQSFQDFIGGAVGGGLGSAMRAVGKHFEKVKGQTELGNAVRSRADLTEQAKGLSEEAGKKITAAEEKLEAKKEKLKQKADKKGKTVSTAKIDSKTKLQSKHLTRTVGKYVQQNLEYEEAKKTVSDYADKGEGISAKDITKNAELKSAVKKLAGKNPSAVKNTGVKGVVEKAAKKVIGETVTKKNAVAQFEKAKATEVSDVGKRAIKSVQNYLYDKENAAAVEYAKNVAKTFPNSFFAQKAQAVDIDYYTKEDASGLLSLTERVGEAYARVRKTDTKTATPTSGLLTDLTFLSGTDVTAENFSEMLEKVKKQGAKADSLETLADAVERSAELISELDEKDKRLIKRYRPDVREMLMEEEGDEDVIEGDGSHLIPLEKRIEAYEVFKSAAKAGIAEDVDLSRYEGRISQKLKAKAIADGAAEVARDGRKGTSYALLDRADFDRKMKSRNFAAQVRLINALARKWGVHVTFTDMLGNGVYADASNGLFVGNNQIVIDINSDYGMLTATFTHEGYHYLEKRNKTAAEEMKKLVFDMLGEEGAKKARKEMRARGYAKDVIDSEIVADSLFDVLSEKGIIKEMSKETRVTVSEMLRHLSDSIREMLSRLTGTETWRIELRDKATNYRHLSNMFMNAMDTAADDVQRAELVEDIRGEVRYSIKYTTDNKPVVVVSENILDGVPESEWVKTVKDTIRNKFPNGIPISGRLIKVNGVTRSEFTNSKYSKHLKSNDKVIYKDKFKAANNLDEIVLASTNYINEDLNHSRKDSIVEFARGDVLLRIGESDYAAKVIVGFTSGKQMLLYDIVDFTKTVFTIKNKDSSIDFGKNRNLRSELSSDNTISQNKGIVNTIISENSENDSTKRQSKKKDIESLLFDEDFYRQFENEDRQRITESVEDLQKQVEEMNDGNSSFEKQFDVRAKMKALKAGYKSVYDYYVGKEKKNILKEYEVNPEKFEKKIKQKEEARQREENLKKDIESASPHKRAQFEIIQQYNPMWDEYHVGIRSPRDIKTFAEVINDGESFAWGDFDVDDAQKALRRGTVRVYSSYPIKNGVFVSTSYQQALDYAAGEASRVHTRVVALDSVAWINGDEGQYANVKGWKKQDNNVRYSFKKKKSGMANDALLPYDAEMTGLIERGGNIIVDSYDKLVDAVNRAFENPNDKVTMYFGILDNDVLSAINKKIPNLPTEANGSLFKPGRQYSVAATFDSIRHLVSDKSGLTIEDVIDYLDRFADTIVDSDTATFNYYIRGNLKINGILFKKSYQDGTILNFDLVSNKKKIVGLQTLYMKKADYKKRKSAETLLMQKASTHTSKTQVGQTFLTNDNTFSDKSQEVSFDKKQSKKKEAVKALKAEDVFGKDYKAEYAALKEETENIRKEIAVLSAEEHIDSGYRQKQTERLTQILEKKEALLKRMDSLRTILAQLQARNANVSRYAKLFLDNFQAVKKTGSYRATGENWEIMKAVSEITDTYEPTVSDFATKAGLAKLQKEHKQIYDAFMAYARDKAYIRPFNLSEYKSVLEKLAKEYKAEGADISGLAAELKNAVEIYLNKAADKQPSYEALVREFDVILSDITEKSEKLADKSEWAQKIKGQTVKLVGDQYRNVIDTFGSLAEANRYMNGAVKFSRLKGITLTEALDGQRADELLKQTDKEFRHGWEVVSETEAKAEENNRAYGKAGTQSAYGAKEGKQSAYGGRTDVKAYSPQETKTETNNLTEEEQAQAERIKAETEAKKEILDFAKAVHELFSRKTSTEASAEKSVGREVFEKLLEIKKADPYFNQFKAETAEINRLMKESEEAAAAYWKAERQISYDLGKNNAYARAFERETRKTERRNLAEFRDKLGRLLSQISKKLTAKDVTGSVKRELANLVRSFEVDDEIGYTQLSRVIDAVKKGAIEAQKEILDGDSMALYTKQIDSLASKMDGRTLNSLNAPEMKEVYQLVRAIYKTLNDANKVYLDGRAAELKVVRDEVRREISELGRKKISNFGVILTANPMRFAEVLSNFDRESTIYKTFEDLEKAEYEATSRAFEYLMPFDKLNGSSKVLDKKTSNERLKQYKKFTSDYIDTPFEDADTGEKIQMSRSELLQLYMTWQREIHSDKIRHLQYMGFELGNRKQLKRGDFEKAFEPYYKNTVSLVTLEQMEKVRKILFDGSEAGKYAEEWFKTSQEFFRKAGQDLDMVYYERFFLHLDVDPYYIPMTVDTLEVQGKVPDTMREGETVMKYEQSGKLKEITPHAPQHIKIAGMHGLILNEAKSTANIVELMLPLKQFRTIWGTKLEEGNGRTSSVQKELAEKFTNGKGVRDYLVRLQNDLAGRPRETKVNNVVNNAFNTINGAFISSVLNTPSVIVKQVTALPVALHTVSYKNLGRFSPGGWYKRGITGLPYKVYIKAKRSALLAEYEQHGIYEFSDRLRGTFSVDMARMNEKTRGIIDWALRGNAVNRKLVGWYFNAMVAVDANTCLIIGEAVKRDVIDAGFKKGSAEYWTEVKKRVRKAINYTQQVGGVMHGTELQKTANGLLRTISRFTSQTTMTKSMVQFSFMEAVATRGKATHKEAVRNFGRTLVGFTAGQLAFRVLTELFSILHHKHYKYKDDDEKVTVKNLAKGILFGFVTDCVSTALILSPLTELFSAFVAKVVPNDDIKEAFKTYGVSDPILDVINDLADLITNFSFKDFDAYDAKKVCRTIGSFTGIPAEALYSLIYGFVQYGQDISSGLFVSNWNMLWEKGYFYDIDFENASSGYSAYVGLVRDGETKAAEIFKKALEDFELNRGSKQDEIEDKFEKGVIKALTKDERIAEAYRAYTEGDSKKYAKILDEIKEFPQELVDAAAESYINTVESKIKTACESEDGNEIAAAKKYLEEKLHMTRDEIEFRIGKYVSSVKKSDLFAQIYDAWSKGQDYSELEKQAREKYGDAAYTSGFATELAKNKSIKEAYDAKQAGKLPQYDSILNGINVSENIRISAVEKYASMLDKNIATVFYDIDAAAVREARTVLRRDCHLTDSQIDELAAKYVPKEQSEEQEKDRYKPADVVSCLKDGSNANAKFVIGKVREIYKGKGKTKDDADKAVRTKLTGEYKDEYRYAFATGNARKQKAIISMLVSLDVGYDEETIRKWCLTKKGTHTAEYERWLEEDYAAYKATLR